MDLSRPSVADQGHQRLAGYPSYAAFIAKDKDAATYRRFEHLSARNILYLQSELHELGSKLETLDREDAKDIGNENAQKAARKCDYFANDDSEDSCKRRLLQEESHEKIREYRRLHT